MANNQIASSGQLSGLLEAPMSFFDAQGQLSRTSQGVIGLGSLPEAFRSGMFLNTPYANKIWKNKIKNVLTEYLEFSSPAVLTQADSFVTQRPEASPMEFEFQLQPLPGVAGIVFGASTIDFSSVASPNATTAQKQMQMGQDATNAISGATANAQGVLNSVLGVGKGFAQLRNQYGLTTNAGNPIPDVANASIYNLIALNYTDAQTLIAQDNNRGDNLFIAQTSFYWLDDPSSLNYGRWILSDNLVDTTNVSGNVVGLAGSPASDNAKPYVIAGTNPKYVKKGGTPEVLQIVAISNPVTDTNNGNNSVCVCIVERIYNYRSNSTTAQFVLGANATPANAKVTQVGALIWQGSDTTVSGSNPFKEQGFAGAVANLNFGTANAFFPLPTLFTPGTAIIYPKVQLGLPDDPEGSAPKPSFTKDSVFVESIIQYSRMGFGGQTDFAASQIRTINAQIKAFNAQSEAAGTGIKIPAFEGLKGSGALVDEAIVNYSVADALNAYETGEKMTDPSMIQSAIAFSNTPVLDRMFHQKELTYLFGAGKQALRQGYQFNSANGLNPFIALDPTKLLTPKALYPTANYLQASSQALDISLRNRFSTSGLINSIPLSNIYNFIGQDLTHDMFDNFVSSIATKSAARTFVCFTGPQGRSDWNKMLYRDPIYAQRMRIEDKDTIPIFGREMDAIEVSGAYFAVVVIPMLAKDASGGRNIYPINMGTPDMPFVGTLFHRLPIFITGNEAPPGYMFSAYGLHMETGIFTRAFDVNAFMFLRA